MSDKFKMIPEFRFYPSDMVSLSFNPNACRILFGLENQPGEPEYQTGVFATPATLMVLSALIDASIKRFESITGQKIALPQEKIDEIQAITEKAILATNPAPTASPPPS